MDLRQQVALACQGGIDPVPTAGIGDGTGSVANERTIYALGWIVANAIVTARYRDSAIDALPVYHPENGWDRFLLTRRVSCQYFADEPADAFGLIMLDGE